MARRPQKDPEARLVEAAVATLAEVVVGFQTLCADRRVSWCFNEQLRHVREIRIAVGGLSTLR